MKKAVSLILAFITAVSCSIPAFAGKTDSDSIKIAAAGDLHYSAASEELEQTNSDPVFWYANRRAAMEEESGFIIDSFLNQCAEDDSIDYVLIAGDLADSGKRYPEDHRAVAEKLKDFEDKTGKDVFVINGNHDAGNNLNTNYDLFKEIYADFGYDKAIEIRTGDCSYTADLGEKYRLIALDSNNPDKSTEDGMTADKINWVKKQTKSAKDDGRYPILMMHHNLLDHMPAQRILSRNFIVKFHNTTASLFADWGIKTVISGHEHCSDVSSFTSAGGNVIYDFAVTSLTMYPLAYRVFTFADETIKYESQTIRSIDTDALISAQPALNDIQTDKMNEDLNAYAKGFLKAGVQYRLERSLSPEKLGVNENSVAYNAVSVFSDRLISILNTDYEGENGIIELAEQYNIDIDPAGYKNGWDIATELVSSHYAGEESNDLDSDEVTLLLKTASLILKDIPAYVTDNAILNGINSIVSDYDSRTIQNLTKKYCSEFGGITPGEYLITAMLAPFLYEFAFDADGVNDNNGVIAGYGVKTNRAGNIADNIKNFFEKLISYIDKIMSGLEKLFK